MSQVSDTGWQIFVVVAGKAPIELPDGESVIGRSRACLVQIAETTVSRQHAIFVVAPGKVRLRDLGSSNGTFVNGQKVDGEIPLQDGDRIVVGEAELVLRVLAPLGPAEATVRMVLPPLTARAEDSAPPAHLLPQSAERMPAAQPAGASAPPAFFERDTPPAMPALHPERAAAPPASTPASPPKPSFASPPPLPTSPPSRPAPLAPAPVLSALPPLPDFGDPAPRPAATAAEPAAGAKASELLSSIRDIDLAPVPAVVVQRKNTVLEKTEPAGFWRRVVASLLDAIPFVVLAGAQFGVAMFISPSIGNLLLILPPLYGLLVYLVLPALVGWTPGKKLMKLAIVSETTVPGQGLGWGTAGLRLVGYLVCSITFGLGYLLVAFSARKQGLHDLIAKTNVVRKR
ncbi:MAG: FHA domain-containing protein [Thermoanaerobaculia bacterium]